MMVEMPMRAACDTIRVPRHCCAGASPAPAARAHQQRSERRLASPARAAQQHKHRSPALVYPEAAARQHAVLRACRGVRHACRPSAGPPAGPAWHIGTPQEPTPRAPQTAGAVALPHRRQRWRRERPAAASGAAACASQQWPSRRPSLRAAEVAARARPACQTRVQPPSDYAAAWRPSGTARSPACRVCTACGSERQPRTACRCPPRAVAASAPELAASAERPRSSRRPTLHTPRERTASSPRCRLATHRAPP